MGGLAGGTGNSLWGLLDDLLALGEDHLDVAWVGHVWVDLSCVLALVVKDIGASNLHDRGHGRYVSSAWEPG